VIYSLNILSKLQAEDDNEITDYVLETLNNKEDIKKIDLAFNSAIKVLNRLFN